MMRTLAGVLVLTLLPLLGGCGLPSFLVTPVQDPNRLETQTVVPGKGLFPDRVAIIEVEGMILNAKGGGLLQATENPVSRFIQELDRAAADHRVKAVVLRVNSPGGAVTASDIMYQKLLRFKQETKKPVVASMQDVAASGAYYIACGADRIVAQPTGVVGSIGVIFMTFHIDGTLKMIGATTNTIKSGPFKDMGSPLKPLDPEAKALMQQMVDEYYARFVGIVREHRKLDAEKLKLATDGRVFSGQKGVEIGLVDRAGTLYDAIDEAKSLAGIGTAEVIMYRRPYGYSGSIYAQSPTPAPQSNVLNVNVPGLTDRLPTGFYFLWAP